MENAILYDCEALPTPGAPQRVWDGVYDPDPAVAPTLQAGIVDRFSRVVGMLARFGKADRLRRAAGIQAQTVYTQRRPGLRELFGLNADDLQAHDALGDVEPVARAARHPVRERQPESGMLCDRLSLDLSPHSSP